MTTVDHRPGVHNRAFPSRSEPARDAAPFGVFRPCRAIGGAILPVPTASFTAFEANNEAPDIDFVVGVVDTGLVLTAAGKPHPWLDGHVAFHPTDDRDPVAPKGILRSDDGHGTFVAGLVLREAPRAHVRTIRGVDRDLFGNPDRPTSAELNEADEKVAGAIYRLLDPAEKLAKPASIINLSFYGVFPAEEPPTHIHNAIRDASDAGVVVIVAAGNEPRRELVWPAAFAREPELANLYAVGAVDETVCRSQLDPPFVATFSNHQEWVRTYANGVYVNGPLYSAELSYDTSDRPEVHDFFLPSKSPVRHEPTPAIYTGWAKWSGTSFAAATVSGIVARRAMQNRPATVAETAAEVLTPNISLQGTLEPDQLVRYLQGVDCDWPSSY